MPSSYQAGVYSSILHYLKAVKAAGTKDTQKVLAQMRATKVDDFFSHGGYIREDGRMVHDMLLVQAKDAGGVQGRWDLYKILKVLPGEEVFRPLKDGGCPFIKS